MKKRKEILYYLHKREEQLKGRIRSVKLEHGEKESLIHKQQIAMLEGRYLEIIDLLKELQ